MNILYIAPYTSSTFRAEHGDFNTPGIGGERKLELIVAALLKGGHRVVVLSSAMLSVSKLSVRKKCWQDVPLEGGGSFKVIYPPALMLRPLGGLINCLFAAKYVREVISEYHVDAAIIYNAYLFETIATKQLLSATPMPICLEIEDLPLARKRGVLNIKPFLDQICWSGMLRRASSFLAVNQAILDMLPDGKRKTLLPGIVSQRLLEEAEARGVPFTKAERVVGYFGALTPEKGVQILLELVPRLAPPWRLVVSGSGPKSQEFEALSARYPERCRFLGRVSEAELYRAMCVCDCVVIPLEQITDGGKGVFPFKTLEYLVSRSHVVSTLLAGQNDLDLSFINRWDGSTDDLLCVLARAQDDYKDEAMLRASAIDYIVSNFTISQVGTTITSHLSISTGGEPT
jgi:glycosyltransferase involved in cell wall biosynthesis